MTAQNATRLDRANDQPRQDQTTHTPIVAPAEKTGKPIIERTQQFRDLRDRLAARGHTLIAAPSGGLIVSRWGLHRVLDDLPAVEAFALEVGCPR